MSPSFIARVRWSNVAVALLAAGLVGLVVAWPLLTPDPPALPPDPRVVAEDPAVTPPVPHRAGRGGAARGLDVAADPRRRRAPAAGHRRRAAGRRAAEGRRAAGRSRRRTRARRAAGARGSREPRPPVGRRRDRAGPAAPRPAPATAPPAAPAPQPPAPAVPPAVAGAAPPEPEFGFEQ